MHIVHLRSNIFCNVVIMFPSSILCLKNRNVNLMADISLTFHGVEIMFANIIIFTLYPVAIFQRWAVSGDIECFHGSHMALTLLAILVLTVSVLLIPAVAALSMVKVSKEILMPLNCMYSLYSF